jgi:hypothetical protein
MSVIASCVQPEIEETTGTISPDSNLATVLEEVEAYYADFSTRDWEAFADHFWEGATLSTIWPAPGEDTLSVWTFTVPEFVASAPEGPGSKPIFEERMTEAEVQESGDLAQVWAHYEARFGDEQEVMEWAGIDAFTLMRFDGRWRITSLAYATE